MALSSDGHGKAGSSVHVQAKRYLVAAHPYALDRLRALMEQVARV